MRSDQFTKAALFALIVVCLVLSGWEYYVRHHDFRPSFDDGGALWSDKRDKVYDDPSRTTVFIGSSRIKYDLDINTWRSMTGDEPVMLAMPGQCPRPTLKNLADDKGFRGKLIIDVTEPLFFSDGPGSRNEIDENIHFYEHNHTPAQKASFVLNHVLESRFAFLDKDHLSLSALIDRMKIPSRPGVFVFPTFAPGFERNSFDRQSYMSPGFVADTNQWNQVKGVWKMLFAKKGPPVSGDSLVRMIHTVRDQVAAIRNRGGQVLFVRTPSSDPMKTGELKGFPRNVYWQPLLDETGCPGIHFMDYPAIDHFICPELSHLSPADAVVFTQHLVKILHEEQHWNFPAMSSTSKN